MTAYLVLQQMPLRDGEDGPDFTVSRSDVSDTAMRRSRDESTVEVRDGERLTERDALMAVLLPSANNVAVLLARSVSGSVDRFVTEMNRSARLFGMSHTTYTDPSGFDDGTVSTAVDQLLLAQVAAGEPTLADMMAERSYELPVAGTVHNTDSLLGRDGFVGMKTGSDDAAGGCFMFRSRRMVDGHAVDLIGVVLGQQGRRLVTAGLYSAKQLADRVAPGAAR
jgi:D-alanyl-D-alanine carboxypeptidase (penicillin-binding protein 5/6)